MKRVIKNIAGQRIAEGRKKQGLGLTQFDLSNALGIKGIRLDRAAVAKIERGLRGVLDYEILAIAEVLKVSPEQLLTGRARPAPRIRRAPVAYEEEDVSKKLMPEDRPLGFID